MKLVKVKRIRKTDAVDIKKFDDKFYKIYKPLQAKIKNDVKQLYGVINDVNDALNAAKKAEEDFLMKVSYMNYPGGLSAYNKEEKRLEAERAKLQELLTHLQFMMKESKSWMDQR